MTLSATIQGLTEGCHSAGAGTVVPMSFGDVLKRQCIVACFLYSKMTCRGRTRYAGASLTFSILMDVAVHRSLSTVEGDIMADTPRLTKPEWEIRLSALLPLFGHRNWIVVADSAYPAQSRPGIETIVSGSGQLEVARKVLDAVTASKHVRANVYLDKELEFVPEDDAPGVMRYRDQLAALLGKANPTRLLHEEIIARLDESAQVFRVLIIKTEMTIPYTTVFFQLNCGYWSDEGEQRLRRFMPGAK